MFEKKNCQKVIKSKFKKKPSKMTYGKNEKV